MRVCDKGLESFLWLQCLWRSVNTQHRDGSQTSPYPLILCSSTIQKIHSSSVSAASSSIDRLKDSKLSITSSRKETMRESTGGGLQSPYYEAPTILRREEQLPTQSSRKAIVYRFMQLSHTNSTTYRQTTRIEPFTNVSVFWGAILSCPHEYTVLWRRNRE